MTKHPLTDIGSYLFDWKIFIFFSILFFAYLTSVVIASIIFLSALDDNHTTNCLTYNNTGSALYWFVTIGHYITIAIIGIILTIIFAYAIKYHQNQKVYLNKVEVKPAKHHD